MIRSHLLVLFLADFTESIVLIEPGYDHIEGGKALFCLLHAFLIFPDIVCAAFAPSALVLGAAIVILLALKALAGGEMKLAAAACAVEVLRIIPAVPLSRDGVCFCAAPALYPIAPEKR